MKQPNDILMGVALAASLLLTATSSDAQESRDSNLPAAVAAQQKAEVRRGDPARWYQEDKTLQAHLRTLQKEIKAGLQESRGACRTLPAADQKQCLNEAQMAYQHDMANVRAQAMQDMAQR